MKYKAFISDFDGTLKRHNAEHVSDRVLAALRKAEKHLSVGIATGRPLLEMQHHWDDLALSSPCIMNGGAQIYDPISKMTLWDRPLLPQDVHEIVQLVRTHNLTEGFILNSGKHDCTVDEYDPGKKYYQLGHNLVPETTTSLYESLTKHIPTITMHVVQSGNPALFYTSLTHAEATKQHGIYEVAKILGIKPHEIIGIGDSGNDLPLLMACGLKIAMGNASEDLKALADYVAPSVDDDGVAHVIEKFILP